MPQNDAPRPAPEPSLHSSLWSEADRLAALEGYAILDTPLEQEFNDLVKLAAETFGAR